MRKLIQFLFLIILVHQSIGMKRLKKNCFYQMSAKELNKTQGLTKPTIKTTSSRSTTTTTTTTYTTQFLNSTIGNNLIVIPADRAINDSSLSPLTSLNVMTAFNARNMTQRQMAELRALLVGSCWRDSYTRGAGESISECYSDEDKDGALCYPKCPTGYNGVGPVCWEICKNGFSDRGVFCIQDLLIIGKSDCKDTCPKNFTDDGCTCRRSPISYTKKSFGRTAGTPLKCKKNFELDGALCYPKCSPGWSGAGPVCWKNCIEPLINDCGGMCTISESVCAYKTFDIVYLLGFPFKNMLYWINGPIALLDLTTITDIPVAYSIPKCF